MADPKSWTEAQTSTPARSTTTKRGDFQPRIPEDRAVEPSEPVSVPWQEADHGTARSIVVPTGEDFAPPDPDPGPEPPPTVEPLPWSDAGRGTTQEPVVLSGDYVPVPEPDPEPLPPTLEPHPWMEALNVRARLADRGSIRLSHDYHPKQRPYVPPPSQFVGSEWTEAAGDGKAQSPVTLSADYVPPPEVPPPPPPPSSVVGPRWTMAQNATAARTVTLSRDYVQRPRRAPVPPPPVHETVEWTPAAHAAAATPTVASVTVDHAVPPPHEPQPETQPVQAPHQTGARREVEIQDVLRGDWKSRR